MFSMKEKQWLADEIEKLLLKLEHPEMPKAKPSFKLHVDGAESWSWADIEPNWKFDGKTVTGKTWNEISRDVIKG